MLRRQFRTQQKCRLEKQVITALLFRNILELNPSASDCIWPHLTSSDCMSQDASQEISVQDFEEVEGFSEDRSNFRVTELHRVPLVRTFGLMSQHPSEDCDCDDRKSCEDCEDCEDVFRELLSVIRVVRFRMSSKQRLRAAEQTQRATHCSVLHTLLRALPHIAIATCCYMLLHVGSTRFLSSWPLGGGWGGGRGCNSVQAACVPWNSLSSIGIAVLQSSAAFVFPLWASVCIQPWGVLEGTTRRDSVFNRFAVGFKGLRNIVESRVLG